MMVDDGPSAIALHLPSSQTPTLISATDRYIAAATPTSISSFQLDPPQALADWKPPTHYSITALKLSPDSEALAAVIHRPNDTALVLLHPHTLSRLFRIALSITSPSPVIAFVSPPRPSAPSTKSLLPKHLLRVFAQFDRTSSTSEPPSTPTAPFALALSPTSLSNSPLILVFHRRYKRLHHLTTLPQNTPLKLLSVPNLTALTPELVFYDNRTIHYSSPSASHHIDSDFPIQSVLATVHAPCFAIAAVVEHPQNQTCIAVFRESSTILTPVNNPLPNAAIMKTSNATDFLLGTATTKGITVIAELLLRPYVIIDVIPREDAALTTVQENLLCVPPSPFTPLSVIVKDGTVLCRYSQSKKTFQCVRSLPPICSS